MKITINKIDDGKPTFNKIVPGTLFVYEDGVFHRSLCYKHLDCERGRNMLTGVDWKFASTDTAYPVKSIEVSI